MSELDAMKIEIEKLKIEVSRLKSAVAALCKPRKFAKPQPSGGVDMFSLGVLFGATLSTTAWIICLMVFK